MSKQLTRFSEPAILQGAKFTAICCILSYGFMTFLLPGQESLTAV